MKRALQLLPALALLGWAASADARAMPNRAQIERAVNAWFACHTGPDCTGYPAFRRRLTSARCIRLPWDQTHPGRILCLFSGVDSQQGRPDSRFRNDCVYMMPNRRGWEVSSIPDADLCE